MNHRTQVRVLICICITLFIIIVGVMVFGGDMGMYPDKVESVSAGKAVVYYKATGQKIEADNQYLDLEAGDACSIIQNDDTGRFYVVRYKDQ